MPTTITKTDLLKEDPNYYKAKKSPEIRDLDISLNPQVIFTKDQKRLDKLNQSPFLIP